MGSDVWTLLGLVGLVTCAVLGWLRRAAREGRRARAAAAADEETRRNRASEAIAQKLRTTDPEFHVEAFEERVARAFVAVQKGRSSGDRSVARPFVSDGVYERLNLELEDRRHRGAAEDPMAWHVDEVHLAYAESGEVFDQLTVGIRALARGEPTGEFWTFLRRHGTRTRKGPGLLERRCPNCGTPIELVERADCASCGSALRSGEHDWVLCGITQPEVWLPRATARISGVEALREADPGFCPQHLEDRVGVLFWRMLLAERERSGAERLAAVAAPEWCDRFEAEQEMRRRPSRLASARDVEIRGIEVVGAREEEGWHRIVVSVRWRSESLRRGGGKMAGRGARMFAMVRLVGAVTDPERAVSSAHCPACGAPDEGSRAGCCAYCGLCLNDGTRSWILVDAFEAESVRAHEVMADFRRGERWTAPVPELEKLPPAAFPWVAKLLSADAPLDVAARQRLAEIAETRATRAADPRLDPAAHTGREGDIASPDILRALPILIDIGLAHDALGERGRAVLCELAARAGLTRFDVDSRIDQRLRRWDGREAAEREAEEKQARSRAYLEWSRVANPPDLD